MDIFSSWRLQPREREEEEEEEDEEEEEEEEKKSSDAKKEKKKEKLPYAPEKIIRPHAARQSAMCSCDRTNMPPY